MHVIVPLAGPDFVGQDGDIKALKLIDQQPLLKRALDSRPWSSEVINYSFVLYDCIENRIFARDHLLHWYDTASIVYISRFSRGAAISALAGLSTLGSFNQPLIIDLADILYSSVVNIANVLRNSVAIGGIALVFSSQHPQYSYLRCDGEGRITEAAEKRLISDHASAGTYIFRNSAIFLKAVAHAIENESTQTYNNLFYVCPLFNGIIAQSLEVALEPVSNIMDIKLSLAHHD